MPTKGPVLSAWLSPLGMPILGAPATFHLRPPATVLTAIATYRQDQWETLLTAAADRETMDETSNEILDVQPVGSHRLTNAV
jgi:hypothetical protein